MKTSMIGSALFFFLGIVSSPACTEAHGGSEIQSSVSVDCSQYKGSARYATCQHAREYGLTMQAAALVEDLAEHDHAIKFCGGSPDPADLQHTESILAGGEAFRTLYKAQRDMLDMRCVYDPDGWCRSMGFERR